MPWAGYKKNVENFYQSDKGKEAFFYKTDYKVMKNIKDLGPSASYTSILYFRNKKPIQAELTLLNSCDPDGIFQVNIRYENAQKNIKVSCRNILESPDGKYIYMENQDSALKAKLRKSNGFANMYFLTRPSDLFATDFLYKKESK